MGWPRTRFVVAAALALSTVAAVTSSAQEPGAPPPPAGGRGQPGTRYHELLPDIGRIGAQVGAALGPSWNPYGVGAGWQVSAFIDLPLARTRGGRLSYEILLGLSGGDGDVFTISDPARRQVRTRLRLLDVSPFALKYTLTGLDHARLRPYVTAGLDVAVIGTELLDESPSPVADSPELEALGIRDADARLSLGGHAGLGMEIRISRGLSLNLDYRLVRIDGSRTLQAASSVVGFHW
jgi:opacity protein-like surface antigen